jgi:RNA polymerase sigma-70 factor, ECF subfamily
VTEVTQTDIDEALTKARAGDAEAYGKVVFAYQARLRAFVSRYVIRGEWVDDIVQQAFITAFQNLSKFEIGTDFYAWLGAIAFNQLRAELKKASRRQLLERDYLVEVTARELSKRLEDEGRDSDARLDALRGCLSRLPQKTQALVARYYNEGQPLAALATEFDRTADGLKVTLFRIRAQLKECIQHKIAARDS